MGVYLASHFEKFWLFSPMFMYLVIVKRDVHHLAEWGVVAKRWLLHYQK